MSSRVPPGSLLRTASASAAADMNLLPLPGWLWTRMSPPCSRRILRLTARPRPVPLAPLVLTNGLKISSSFCGAMPTPLSSNDDADPAVRRSSGVPTVTCGVAAVLDRVQGVADDVEQGAVDAFRIGRHDGQIVAQARLQLDVAFLGPARPAVRPRRSTTVVEVGRLDGRLAFLGVAEHVHDQLVDLALVLLGHLPALLNEAVVLFLQAHLEDFAAGPQPLQDVLDVVRQGGDGLADGRQALGLHHGVVVARLLDGQGGLVGQGDGQGQMVLGELADRAWAV